MTSKIQITDEMVERAYKQHPHAGTWKDDRVSQRYAKATIREMLEAALNPPEEPEIPVSEGMIAAGAEAWNEQCGVDYYEEPPTNEEKANLAALYRAMEKARRKEQEAVHEGTEVIGQIRRSIAPFLDKAWLGNGQVPWIIYRDIEAHLKPVKQFT